MGVKFEKESQNHSLTIKLNKIESYCAFSKGFLLVKLFFKATFSMAPFAPTMERVILESVLLNLDSEEIIKILEFIFS